MYNVTISRGRNFATISNNHFNVTINLSKVASIEANASNEVVIWCDGFPDEGGFSFKLERKDYDNLMEAWFNTQAENWKSHQQIREEENDRVF